MSLTVFAVPTIPAISAALALGRLMQVSEMKGIEDAYRYRMYDTNLDDYLYSTRYATMVKINRIGAEPIYPGIKISKTYLADGWTKKDFDPKCPA